MRPDAWWLELVPVIVLLGGFGIYATLRAFEGNYYEWGPFRIQGAITLPVKTVHGVPSLTTIA
jgi:hypothetical protein